MCTFATLVQIDGTAAAATSAPKQGMTGADLRAKLHSKENVYGTCCLSTSPKWPAMLAQSGIDCVFIDTEHVPIPIDTLAWMCNTFSGLGVPPITRVAEPEPYKICEYLDAGAKGIVAPYLETVEQVKMLVGCTKLRPLKGEKLKLILDNLKPIKPEDGARTNEILYEQVDAILGETLTSTFMKKKNKDVCLLLNIESVAAVNRLGELLAIPGVDSTLVGPHDLSCNYGVPEQWTSRTFLDPLDTIIDVSSQYNMGCGIHYSFTNQLDLQVEWSKRGANLVMHSADIKLVSRQLMSDLAYIRAGNGDGAMAEQEEVEGV
eukprot:gene6812-3664_t